MKGHKQNLLECRLSLKTLFPILVGRKTAPFHGEIPDRTSFGSTIKSASSNSHSVGDGNW